MSVAAAVGSMTLVALVGLIRLHVGYWNDEGISVGIASQPITRIPGLLRQDSSPPAYYLMLHGWMRVFGQSPGATHLLSLVAAVAAVPVVGWSARTFFGARAAIAAMLLCGLNPFLWWYGTETRMYAFIVPVATATVTLFLTGLRTGRLRRLVAAVACASFLTYLHDWGWFVIGALVVAGAFVAVTGSSARSAWWSFGFAAGVGLLYVPWVPSLLYQLAHTDAPWSSAPSLSAVVSGPLRTVAGDAWPLLLAVLLVATAMMATRSRAGDHTILLLALVVGVADVSCWIGGLASAAWVERYLAILVGPLTVLVGGLLARWWAGDRMPAGPPPAEDSLLSNGRPKWRKPSLFSTGPVLPVAVVAVVAISSVAGLVPAGSRSLDTKSNIAGLASQLRPYLGSGTVVLATDTSQVPVIAFYLGRSARYGDPLGLTDITYMTDWVDLTDRLTKADPAAVVAAADDSMAPGSYLIVIGPPFGPPGPGYGGVVVSEAQQLAVAAANESDLVAVRFFASPATQNPMDAVVYSRQ